MRTKTLSMRLQSRVRRGLPHHMTRPDYRRTNPGAPVRSPSQLGGQEGLKERESAASPTQWSQWDVRRTAQCDGLPSLENTQGRLTARIPFKPQCAYKCNLRLSGRTSAGSKVHTRPSGQLEGLQSTRMHGAQLE